MVPYCSSAIAPHFLSPKKPWCLASELPGGWRATAASMVEKVEALLLLLLLLCQLQCACLALSCVCYPPRIDAHSFHRSFCIQTVHASSTQPK